MNPLSIECEVHFHTRGRGRKELEAGTAPPRPAAPGRVPRVARLLALAHRMERLMRAGVVRDYAELARLGRVTRARVSQVMALLLLAPDIQEQVLSLPPTERGRDRVVMCHLLPVAATADWKRQRRLWAALANWRTPCRPFPAGVRAAGLPCTPPAG